MIFLRLSEHFADRASEWVLSGCLLTIGLNVLLMDSAIWQSPVYASLATLLPQYVCGALALSIGLGRVIALYINGTRRRSPHARAIGAFFAVFFWLQLALGLLAAPTVAFSAAIVPWLLVAEIWNVHRAARDARLSDMRMWPVEGAAPDATSA